MTAFEVWCDGYGRYHALVPIAASHPRQLALELIAVAIAEMDCEGGSARYQRSTIRPTFTEALQRAVEWLENGRETDAVVVNRGTQTQRIAGRGGQVEYVEYAMEQDEL